MANVVATVTTAVGILLLWTEETPGWWFSLMFSVLLGALSAVLWFVFFGSLAAAREDREAQAAWSAVRDRASAETGRVLARRVQLAEEGSPTSFELDIALDGGVPITARWSLEWASQRLSEAQLPGVGSPARVWRATSVPSAPVVVEVADPSVV